MTRRGCVCAAIAAAAGLAAATASAESASPPAASATPSEAMLPGSVPFAPGGPARLEASRDVPPPAGYHLVTRPHRLLLTTGVLTVGALYVGSALVAVSRAPDYETDALAIPLLGPFLAIHRAEQGGGVDSNDEDREDERDLKYIAYAFDGALQFVGAALIVNSLALPERWYVRDDVEVALRPMRFGRHGAGAAVVGRF